MKIAIFALALVFVAGGTAIYVIRSDPSTAAPGPPGMQAGFDEDTFVVVDAARQRAFVDEIEAIGTTRANESLTLTAKVTDTVSTVNFSDGDRVEADHVLVELGNQEQTALLAEAKANLDDSKRQLDRIEDLVRRNSVPISQADEVRARHAASRARYEAIVARLDDRLIRAPFAGVLGFRQVSPGTLVAPGTPIVTLDDISVIKLDFTVPEVYLAALSEGLHVIAQSPAFPNRRFEGEVKTINSRIDPVTRSVVVRAHITNADGTLRPGMLLTVRVRRPETIALAVREVALLQVADKSFVYVAEEGRAWQREVRTGQRDPGYVEITDGLAEGDFVVTEGLIKLRDGAAIRTTDMQGS